MGVEAEFSQSMAIRASLEMAILMGLSAFFGDREVTLTNATG